MFEPIKRFLKKRRLHNGPLDSLDIVETVMALEEAGLRLEDSERVRHFLEREKGLSSEEAAKAIGQMLTKDDFSATSEHRPKTIVVVVFWALMIGLAIVLWIMASAGGVE